MTENLDATVRRTRAPSVARFALSFVPFVLMIALDRLVHVGWFGWVVLIGVGLPSAWRDRPRKQSVTASPAGLKLDDELVPRTSLVNAMSSTDQNDQTWLRIECRDDSTIEVAVPSQPRAHALVEALELDEANMALEVRLKSHARGALGGGALLLLVATIYLAAVYMRDRVGTVVFALVIAGVIWPLVSGRLRGLTVVAGIDGIAIAKRRNEAQFISWADIDSVGADGNDVVVRRTNGDTMRLDAMSGYRRAISASRATAIAIRLESARRAWSETPEPPKVLGLGQGAFRRSDAPNDVLWDALRNPKTRISDRVVAAAALRQRGDRDDVPRLRVAVERYASPARARVRAVLDAEDESLERVVDEMSRE